jgi:hypothetical protein
MLRTLFLSLVALLLTTACRSGDGVDALPADVRGDGGGDGGGGPADVRGDVPGAPDGAPDGGDDTPDAAQPDAPAPDVPPSTLARGCDGARLPGVPDDPALPGPWPVGARAVTIAGYAAEVWYPAAPGSQAGLERLRYDVRPYLPAGEGDKIPDEENPFQDCACWRDLPLDEAHGPYPLLLFVHGTAGYPQQSVEQVTHWTSRGFVVVAADHPGLRLADILTFNLAGRDLPGDITKVLDALVAPAGDVAFLAGHLAEGRVGLVGHSAGGGAVAGFAGRPGVRVIAPLTGSGVDALPPGSASDLALSLVVGAIDDRIVPFSRLESELAVSPYPRVLVGVANAGHLLPTSLCALGADEGGLLQVAIDNGVNVPPFIAVLATDGCGPDQLPPAEGWEVVNAFTAAGFESVLHCTDALADQLPTLAARYTETVGVLRAEWAPPPPAPVTAFPWAGESWDEVCGNGADDDGNGYADCDDFACSRNPAVTVCGARSRWETSPALCTNGRDDDGDGLVDCADPDCAQNPFHATCPRPPVETCEPGVDADGDGFTGCADLDCAVRRLGGCDGAGRTFVLFDQTLDETAACGPNSDWMVDGLGAWPEPSNPTGPDDWKGALSSFGYALVASGDYLVATLPSTDGRLTWQDDTNEQDLSGYDVLVLFEPSRPIPAEARAAVLRFVDAGGGLLLVANHVGADRDGNGTAAPQALNGLLDDETLGPDPFGFRFDEVDVDTGAALTRLGDPHPVLGAAGGDPVTRIGFYQGCSAHLTGGNPTARGLVFLPGSADVERGLAVGVAEVGQGRVVFVTDSAIGGDGSDSHGTVDPGHDSWNNAGQHNSALFRNAIRWLAEREEAPPP